MVRVKDSRPRYSKDHYSAPIVTISVDEKQRDRGYQREDYRDKYSSNHQLVNQVHSNSTTNDDDFNEYDYEIIDGRGNSNNIPPPRIDFGGSHQHQQQQHHHQQQQHESHRPGTKYENCFKNIDSDYDIEAEEEEEEDPMPLPDIRPTTKHGINLSRSTGSFRTALNNHPLVKQQQQRQQTVGNNGYEKIRPTMGTKIQHQKSDEYDSDNHRSQGYGRRVTTTANSRQRRQSFDDEAFRGNHHHQPQQQHHHHYGRGGYEREEDPRLFSPSKQQNNQQVRLEDVQSYLEEIDEIDEEMPKQKPPKTIQIIATGGTSSTAASGKHVSAQQNNDKQPQRQWEPLNHHQQVQQQQQPSHQPLHQQVQPQQQLREQPQKSQHQKELEEIQQKIQQRRQFAAAKEMEDDRLYDLEMARPSHSSKVRSVVDLLNKEQPSKGKGSLRGTPGQDQNPYKSTNNKVPPTPSKSAATVSAVSTVPPPPPPPQNLLIKAGSITPKLQKPTPVSLATDEVNSSQNDTLPPPPPQLQYRSKSEPSTPIDETSPISKPPKSGADILSDEADLLLQYFKSNWQIVDYLNLKIPKEVIDRMNRLPRKIVFIKDAADFTKLKKPRRHHVAKRLRGGKKAAAAASTKNTLQKQQRVIERVASMKTEEISRIVSGNSSLSRHETEREGEIYDSQPETKIYSKSEQHRISSAAAALEDYHHHQQHQQSNPAIRHSLTTESSEEPVYEDSKWSIIKKGGRFVKKSAAALITKKQSPCPTPVQYTKAQLREMPPPLPPQETNNMKNGGGLRTESRIAAEIKNLKEREEELRRNRAALGLPNVHDLIGNWKNQDSRMCPLRETRSFNHLKINVNEQDGQRNWPPLLQNNGHYGMTKSESFHQLHHHQQQNHLNHHSHQQAPPPPPPPMQQPHSMQSTVITPKYYRRGTYDINGSVNSNTTTCWTPVEKLSIEIHP
uniref:Uncharacterized protein n=1 Tax=Panagrolaimus sp. ES5 TaxID=591445 RepID=A0AC34FPG6_9BILA